MIQKKRQFISLSLVFSLLFSPLGIPSARADQTTFLDETRDEINKRLASAKDAGELPVYWQIELYDSEALNDPKATLEAIEELRQSAAEDEENVRTHVDENRNNYGNKVTITGIGTGGLVGLTLGYVVTRGTVQPSLITGSPLIFGDRIAAIREAEVQSKVKISGVEEAIAKAEPSLIKQNHVADIEKIKLEYEGKVGNIRAAIQAEIETVSKREVVASLEGRSNPNSVGLSQLIDWDRSESLVPRPTKISDLKVVAWKSGARTVINGKVETLFNRSNQAASGPLKEVHEYRIGLKNCLQRAFERNIKENLPPQEAVKVLGRKSLPKALPSESKVLSEHFNGEFKRVGQVLQTETAGIAVRPLSPQPRLVIGEKALPKSKGRLAGSGKGRGGSALTIFLTTLSGSLLGWGISKVAESFSVDLDHSNDGDLPWNKLGKISDVYVSTLVQALSETTATQDGCGVSVDEACIATLTVPSKFLAQASSK